MSCHKLYMICIIITKFRVIIMSIFYRGLYKINFSNQSYIRAIMQYNAKIWIEAIQFKVLPTDVAVKTIMFPNGLATSQLEEQISQISSQFATVQEMEVQYRSADSKAMFNVLHPISSELYKKLNITPGAHHGRSLLRTQDNLLMDYVSAVVFSATNSMDMAMVSPALPVCALSREKAIELVLKQSKSTDFQCIELPELQTIVFGSFTEKAACFYVTYGDKFDADDLNYISLDLDDGFLFKYQASAKAQQIHAVMQGYFEAWVANNYEGSLFPQEMALGFDIVAANTLPVYAQLAPQVSASHSSVITRGHPLYQPKASAANDASSATVQIHISTDNYADYKAMDPRVISTGSWQECTPMRTSVTVLKQHEREIIGMLKTQPGVQFVNGEITEYGVQAQAEMRSAMNSFSMM